MQKLAEDMSIQVGKWIESLCSLRMIILNNNSRILYINFDETPIYLDM